MIAVVVISTENAAIARALLPATECIAAGAGRLYLVYATDGRDDDFAYTDLDGESLLDCHVFDTLADADAWVRADVGRAA